MRLLFRFYDPQSGTITVNNQNVREVNLDSLRRVIGIVPQVGNFVPLDYSKTCVKGPLKNRQNKDHNDKW